jgi:hypothetical protein
LQFHFKVNKICADRVSEADEKEEKEEEEEEG